MEKQPMRIKDLERISGVPRSTIHFYLREGVLHPPVKTGRTMAYYDESHLKRLEEIKKLKMNMRTPIEFIKRQIVANEGFQELTSAKSGKQTENDLYSEKFKELRRQEIIRAGIKVFSAKGFHQTRVKDITDEIDISTGTFYLYFKNKRELFIEIVDEIIRNILGDAAKTIKNENDFEKRLELRAKVFYDNYLRYTEILSQLRAEITGEEDWALQKVRDIYHHLTKPLIREAVDAIELGIIRPIDPDLLSYAMTGLIEIMTFRSTIDSKYTYDDLFKFIHSLVIRGISPEGRT